MEGGKKTSSSIADDLSPSGKYAPPPSSNFSSSSPGYFSSVFPPASAAVGKSHGNQPKTPTVQSKDSKSAVSSQSEESAYFGSSVHYGGRDFYDSSASNQSSGAPKPYKDSYDKGENSNDPNVANRGEWWQVWRQYAQSNKLFWCVFSGLCSLLLLAFAFSFLFL